MSCWSSRDIVDVGVMVVSSDRGLAGAYASTIIRMAEQRIIDLRREGKDVRIFAIGKKAQTYFRYRGYRIERSFLSVTDTPGYGDARAVANSVMGAYASGDVDAVEAFLQQVPIRHDPGSDPLRPAADPATGAQSRASSPAPSAPAASADTAPAARFRWSIPMSLRLPKSLIGCCLDTSRPSSSTCSSKPPPPSIPPVGGR